MAKKWIGLSTAGVLLVSSMALAQRERLPIECRKEIADLCRGADGGFRMCLRTALPKLSDQCRKAMSDRAMDSEKAAPNAREIAYGPDVKQKMDIAIPKGAVKAPILFYVHGGGWSIGDKVAGGASKGAVGQRNGLGLRQRQLPSGAAGDRRTTGRRTLPTRWLGCAPMRPPRASIPTGSC